VSEAIRAAIAAVVVGEYLSAQDAEAAMGSVLDGEVTPAQLAALLIGMRMRGETVDELTGFVRAMRKRVLAVLSPPGTVDTCGTGGDVHSTFNISTAAALVVAATGVPVAKHGNRAVTSASGSSDVIAALGLTAEQSVDEAAASLREDGFCFLHAPNFHPGMRHAGPTRRELGIRTAFNLCGPLANPAGPRRQLVGVADPEAARRVADVLRALGAERAFVVHGERVDELPLDGSGIIYDVTQGGVTRLTVAPEDVGLPRSDTDALAGGDPARSAAIIEGVLRGTELGPPRDVVALNAGAALVVAGRAETLSEGVALALDTISRGDALARTERLRDRERARAARVAQDEGVAQAGGAAQDAGAAQAGCGTRKQTAAQDDGGARKEAPAQAGGTATA
jgi:anthranilate phosphoribosyltransferase